MLKLHAGVLKKVGSPGFSSASITTNRAAEPPNSPPYSRPAGKNESLSRLHASSGNSIVMTQSSVA